VLVLVAVVVLIEAPSTCKHAAMALPLSFHAAAFQLNQMLFMVGVTLSPVDHVDHGPKTKGNLQRNTAIRNPNIMTQACWAAAAPAALQAPAPVLHTR
jgi:hypothetical protein